MTKPEVERKRAVAGMFEQSLLRDAQSPVFLEYCRRVHGVSRFQYNSMSAAHFELLLQSLKLTPGDTFLDLGCAVGSITVDVAQRTGARGVGVDFADGAIQFASKAAPANVDVSFQTGDMDELAFEAASFDAIFAVDTLYFASDLEKTVRDVLRLLKPGGRFVAFFSAFGGPDRPPEAITPSGTALAKALRACGATFEWLEITADDREHWRRAVAATEALKPAWEARGELGAWEARDTENREIVPLIDAGLSARFMYTAT